MKVPACVKIICVETGKLVIGLDKHIVSLTHEEAVLLGLYVETYVGKVRNAKRPTHCKNAYPALKEAKERLCA